MPNDLARVPKVETLARPPARALISARFEVQRNAFIRTAMEKYRGDKDPDASSKLAAELQGLLAEHLDCDAADVAESARYLADEYLQIGDSVLIVSRDTGMPIAKITDEDLWQPNLVPRDSGSMATPLPRLRPELEGFLVRWTFERAKEEKLVQELATRVGTTEYLAQNGDPRLFATTRRGRDIILEDLRSALPDLIPGGVEGALGQFLKQLPVGHPSDGRKLSATDYTLKSYPGFKAYARVSTQLYDHKARNLFFDILTSHRSVIAVQWGREIARTISRLAHAETAPVDLDYETFQNVNGLWFAPPEFTMSMRTKFASFFVIPIVGCEMTRIRVLHAPIGRLVLGKTDIVQREIHGRWEVAATLDYDLFIDWSVVDAVRFSNLAPEETAQAQIV